LIFLIENNFYPWQDKAIGIAKAKKLIMMIIFPLIIGNR